MVGSIDATHTISWVELAWTLFTALGCVFAGKLLFRATEDLYYIRGREINGYREFAAVTTIRLFIFLTLIQFIYTVIGIAAMTQPPPYNPGQHPPTLNVVIGSVFVVTSFFFDIMAYITNVRKRRLVGMLQKELEDEQ